MSTSPALPTGVTLRTSERASLREGAIEVLRGAILSGAMASDKVYSAPSLATEFGVSATPVREAMAQLAAEGLVEVVPNKGFRVVPVTEEDLDDLAQVRVFLEPPATRLAAGLVTDADLPGLRALAEDICAAARAGDLAGYMAADRIFHATLLGLTGNTRLVELCTTLRSQTRLLGLQALAERGELEAQGTEHHQLLDLVEAGDLPGVEALMVTHIAHTRGLWADGEPETAAR